MKIKGDIKNYLKQILKGIGLFIIIYLISAIVMEGIIIAGFMLNGYDVLHGELPEGLWTNLIPLYGFSGFIIVTIIFNKFILKRKISALGIEIKKLGLLPIGFIAGIILVGIVLILLVAFGAYRYNGVTSINVGVTLAYLLAYIIQGFGEEIMCRGFLQKYMEKSVSRTCAILVSSLAFMLPHLTTIMEFRPSVVLISLVNIILVSVLFSLSMIKWNSLWIPAGIHIGWNYMLSYICGLELTGSKGAVGILRFTADSSAGLFHGGEYGIEAGVIVTIMLLFLDIFLIVSLKKNNNLVRRQK